MSPFVPNLSLKHRRVTKHVRFHSNPEQIYLHHRRGDDDAPAPTMSDFINRYWMVIIIAAAVAVILIILLIVAVVKCSLKKRNATIISSNNLMKEKVLSEKAGSDSISPVIAQLGMRPEPVAPGRSANLTVSAPNIMVTPATASPSKTTFPGHNEDPFAYKSMDRKRGNINGPFSSPESPVFQSPDSDNDSISEGDVADIKVGHPFHGGLHQLALYHDQDMSQEYPHLSPESEVNLDEVDLRSPTRTPVPNRSHSRTPPANVFNDLPRTTLASRIASMIGKRASYGSSIAPTSEEAMVIANNEKDGFDDSASESTVTTHEDLTEGELSTLALQFPPPALSSAVRSRAGVPSQTGSITARKMYSSPTEATRGVPEPSIPVPQFNFHHPTGFHKHQHGVPPPPRAISPMTAPQQVAASQPRARSLSPSPPKGLRRPFELTRVASHQNLHESNNSSVPFTSFSESESARARAMAQRRGGEMNRSTSPGSRKEQFAGGRMVSDRYATRNLAAETAMVPRKSDVRRGDFQEVTLEQELRNYSMSPY